MNKKFYTSLIAILCYFIVDSFFLPWIYPGVLIPFMKPEVPVSCYHLPDMGIKISGDNDYLIYITYLFPVSALFILTIGDSLNTIASRICSFIMLVPFALSAVIISRTYVVFGHSEMSSLKHAFGIGLYQTLIASVILFIIGIRRLTRKGII